VKHHDRLRHCTAPTANRGGTTHEIEELSNVEEALIEAAIARGETVHRSPSALPQAVLGVRIAERVSRVA
jgi:hypothetical protein